MYSVKNEILKVFAKLTGKHLCQSLFFNKVAGASKILRTPSSKEHLWWLLLNMSSLHYNPNQPDLFDIE